MKQIAYVGELSSQSANIAVYLEHRLTALYCAVVIPKSPMEKTSCGRKEMQGVLGAWAMFMLCSSLLSY